MDIVNKIDDVYKLINETEEMLDKNIEQEKPVESEVTPNNTEESVNTEGGEEDDAGTPLVAQVKINGKEIWCTTVYKAELPGPEGESKECHNVLAVDKTDEFVTPIEFDFWGDEECPDCTAYADEDGDIEFIETALAYNLSIANLYAIIMSVPKEEQEELRKQGSDVSFVLEKGPEIFQKFQKLDISKEDIEAFFKGIESNGNGAE